MAGAPGLPSDLEDFLGDVIMCFETHGGRSAAVVWPQGEASVVRALVAAHGQGEWDQEGVTRTVARRLGDLIGRRTCARYRTIHAGRTEKNTLIESDIISLILRGTVEVHLSPVGPGWPVTVGQLRYRLLVGEVLYVPRGFDCALSTQHAVALLVELTVEN
ncbi:hypothetical protein [Streptomyces maremycinicus]|uniref:hypothetical protein n=1 Tax=Streptomyces maremycinicus TaxID=1679753 RepID=UPI0007879ADD|nr:hypothetical protein [Streptomyces sp. NBRC 110468]